MCRAAKSSKALVVECQIIWLDNASQVMPVQVPANFYLDLAASPDDAPRFYDVYKSQAFKTFRDMNYRGLAWVAGASW